MIDSIEINEWKNNANYLRIQTEIGLAESNDKIIQKEKERLLSTLDVKYSIALVKKYDLIKDNFTTFPSLLYKEMLAFVSKNPDLSIGIKELRAFIQLQSLEGSVNGFLSRKFDLGTYNNLETQLNDVPIGSLSNNPSVEKMKSDAMSKLRSFKYDVEHVTELINNCINNPEEFSRYARLKYLKDEVSVLKYQYYKDWFNNPTNQQRISF